MQTFSEYLSANSLTSYPLKDIKPVIFDVINNKEILFPNDILVDALFVVAIPNVREVRLQQVSIVTNQLYIQFSLRDINGNIINLLTFTFPQNIVPYQTYTNDFGNVAIKLVPGYGIQTLDNINWVSQVGLPVIDSVIVYPFTKVISLTFENATANGFEKVHSFNFASDRFEGGSNVAIECNNNTINLSVLPGRGTGLYDACSDRSEGVWTLNNVTPDKRGNIVINGGNCFDIIKGDSFLALEHLCDPRCSEYELQAYAYYVNRLKDGLVTLTNTVNTIRRRLIEQMEHYQSVLLARSEKQAPFLDVQNVTTGTSNTAWFESIAVGIYNPQSVADSKNYLRGTMVIEWPNGSGISYVSNTAVIRDSGIVQSLPGPGFTDRLITCNYFAEHDFVLKLSNTTLRNIPLTFVLNEVDTVHPARAYVMYILQPNGIYFTVKYNRIWDIDKNKYRYTFTINLFDNSITPNTVSKRIVFSLNLPNSSLQIKSDSVVLKFNNTTKSLRSTNNFIQWSETVNFTKKVELVFKAEGGEFSPFSGTATMMIAGTDKVFSGTFLVQ